MFLKILDLPSYIKWYINNNYISTKIKEFYTNIFTSYFIIIRFYINIQFIEFMSYIIVIWTEYYNVYYTILYYILL